MPLLLSRDVFAAYLPLVQTLTASYTQLEKVETWLRTTVDGLNTLVSFTCLSLQYK